MDDGQKPEVGSSEEPAKEFEFSSAGVTVNADVAEETTTKDGDVPVEGEVSAAEADAAVEGNDDAPISDDNAQKPAEDIPPAAPAVTSADVKKGGGGKKGKLLALILILIVLVGGGVAAYFLFFNDSGKVSDNESPEPETSEYSEYAIDGDKLSDFDISFLKLNNEKENKIYSPLSIKYALDMVAEGANGDSKDQITNILGDYSTKKYINSDNLSLANAMFIKNDFEDKIKKTYVDNIGEKYGAEVIYDDFTGASNINNWVSGKTFHLIGDLVSDNDVKASNYMLINALAIDMDWKHWIQWEGVEDDGGIYYNTGYKHENYSDSLAMYHKDKDTIEFDGDKNISGAQIRASINNYDVISEKGEDEVRKAVKESLEKAIKENPESIKENVFKDGEDEDSYLDRYMEELKDNYGKSYVSTDFKYYVDDSVKVFAKELKEYGGTTLQYVAIMPIEKDLDDYVKNTSAEAIGDLINSLKKTEKDDAKDGVLTQITGSVPMYEFDYELEDLKANLNEMGIEDIFIEKKADLSNLTEAEGSYISAMAHKANIIFSNRGIKAAAATAAGGLGDADFWDYEWDVPVEEVDLNFNKPFMFLIRNVKTGEVWFSGTVYEPTKLES